MEEKLSKVSKEEMKKQEKYFQNKMKDLKNEENTVREMLNKKKDKEWAELKKESKDLVVNK